jgi:hypothetical protein
MSLRDEIVEYVAYLERKISLLKVFGPCDDYEEGWIDGKKAILCDVLAKMTDLLEYPESTSEVMEDDSESETHGTSAELDPARHCFREDGCARHGSVPEDGTCCCCRQWPEDHTGCDCW